MPQFSKRSLDNLQGVHPDLARVLHCAILDTPIDFTIVEGVRTQARQQQLYAQGRTAPGPRVTNADGVRSKSNHQAKADGYGHAVDLYPIVDGKLQVNGAAVTKALGEIAKHIKATANQIGVRITWGGDWKSPYDPPHFELSTNIML